MVKPDQSAVPQWTQQSKTKGLDPLGMQNSSIRIYQRLLPGISNVTLRVRYYGLYVWLADRYARDVGSTSRLEWQRRVRRAEALYALISQAAGGQTGVGGGIWASKRLAANQDIIDFSADAEPGSATHYLQNPWGVFGQAYQSQLYALGLLATAEGHDVAVPAPGEGDDLAADFGRAVGVAGALFLTTLDRGWVSRGDLSTMASLAPSHIGIGQERDRYQALLLALGADADSPDSRRANTLRLIMHWAQATGAYPDADELRWGMYSGRLPDGTLWDLPADLATHSARWAIYQANEITHVALETLLGALLRRLAERPGGMTLDVLVEAMGREVAAEMGQGELTWNVFREAQSLSPDASSQEDARSEWMLTRHTWQAAAAHDMSDAQQCATSLRSLAVLQLRFAGRQAEIDAELGDGVELGFHSIKTEFEFLERLGDVALDEVVRRIILDRVVRRHLWVATRKLQYQGDYTYLIDTDNGLAQARGHYAPVWTGPRLWNAIAFLRDIGLVDQGGATALGNAALEAA
jgi:hypothetical protein